MYSLKMSVCSVPLRCAGVGALALRGDEVHAEDGYGGAADRHRRGDLVERGCRRRGCPCRRRSRSPRRSGRPRRGCAGRRSHGPSGSACRRRPRARHHRVRGSSCSARWSAGRCRSRRTGGSSRCDRGSQSRRARACRGTPPATRESSVPYAGSTSMPESVVKSASRTRDCAYRSCHRSRALLMGR